MKIGPITGSAITLHCCKAHSKINRKMGNSATCKFVTPENIILTLCTRDYVCEVTRHALFGFNRYRGSFSPNRRSITTLWLFDCPVLSLPFFLDPTPSSKRWTDLHVLWLKRRVSVQGWSFLGVRTMGDHIWGNMSPKLPQNEREAIHSQNGKI